MSTDMDKHRHRWTSPEKAQLVVAVLGLLVGIIALAVQFAR